MTFHDVVADLRLAADRLESDQEQAARRVDALLDGWTGPAAAAYAEGWDDWKRSADTVLRGLATMAELLDAVQADVTATDLGSGAGLDRLTARLG